MKKHVSQILGGIALDVNRMCFNALRLQESILFYIPGVVIDWNSHSVSQNYCVKLLAGLQSAEVAPLASEAP